jgi:hypothetical protein
VCVSGVVRRTFALGASSFWRTWRPHAHHFSADSLFHVRLAHVLISFQKPTKKRHIPHKLGARTKSSHFPHCILSGYHFFFLNTQGTNTHIMTHLLRWWGGVLWAFKRRKYRNRENVWVAGSPRSGTRSRPDPGGGSARAPRGAGRGGGGRDGSTKRHGLILRNTASYLVLLHLLTRDPALSRLGTTAPTNQGPSTQPTWHNCTY